MDVSEMPQPHQHVEAALVKSTEDTEQTALEQIGLCFVSASK